MEFLNRWIKLHEALPKVCESVLICTDKENISSGYLEKRNENLWYIHDQELADEMVIAWQRLPDPLLYSKGSSLPK